MIPKTFSASAMHVAELCMARYKAEYIDRIPKPEVKSAATLGSTCHAALENWVLVCIVNKMQEPSLVNLETFFKIAWQENFGPIDDTNVFYTDGLDMMKNWFEFSSERVMRHKVLSLEEKRTFYLPTKAGPIPFTFIMDRLDQVSEVVFEILDYKSQRWAVNPEDLKDKIQAKAYALALAIMLKEKNIPYEEIRVRFDLLRHGSVGRPFSRAEITETYTYLIDLANKIIDTPEDDAQETLNPECIFCPVKASCGALTINLTSGGIESLDTLDKRIDKLGQIDAQTKANESLAKELSELIITAAMELDVLELTTELNRVNFPVRKTRTVDGDRVEKIIGAELFEFYGGKKITMSKFDLLMKNPKITAEQKKELIDIVGISHGNPGVKVTARSFGDDDD